MAPKKKSASQAQPTSSQGPSPPDTAAPQQVVHPSLSKSHALLVLSPGCQYRPVGPHLLERSVARSQDEQLLSMSVGAVRHDNGTSDKSGKRYYSLSRYGRSFLASASFSKISIQVEGHASDRRGSIDGYYSQVNSPFSGAAVPLLLIPDTILGELESKRISVAFRATGPPQTDFVIDTIVNIFDSLRLFSGPREVSGDAYVLPHAAPRALPSIRFIIAEASSISNPTTLAVDCCKPTMAEAVANTVAAGGQRAVLQLKNAEASHLSPVSLQQIFAVQAIALAASKAGVTVAFDEPCHPLIARARMRGQLKGMIEALDTEGLAKAKEDSTVVGVSTGDGQSHPKPPPLSTEAIDQLLAESIPADVLGASARGIITSVLSRVLSCCLQSERFSNLGLTLPRGVLLFDALPTFGKYAPTGKTFLMGAMARTIEALRKRSEAEGPDSNIALLSLQLRTMMVDAHGCVTKEVGGTEKNIAKMLREARQGASTAPSAATKRAPKGTTIIFLDNLEVIAPPRTAAGASGNSVTDRSLSTLLTELDGVRSYSSSDGSSAVNNVILVATSRSFEAVDVAVRRPGRLDMHIELAPPKADVCAAALAAPLVALWEGGCRPYITAVTKVGKDSTFLPPLDANVIDPTHQELLDGLGFGNLWLRLFGDRFAIPSSVADARYVARQALFAVISRLSGDFPSVIFHPSEPDALRTWASQMAAMATEANRGLTAYLQDEIGRAMVGIGKSNARTVASK